MKLTCACTHRWALNLAMGASQRNRSPSFACSGSGSSSPFLTSVRVEVSGDGQCILSCVHHLSIVPLMKKTVWCENNKEFPAPCTTLNYVFNPSLWLVLIFPNFYPSWLLGSEHVSVSREGGLVLEHNRSHSTACQECSSCISGGSDWFQMTCQRGFPSSYLGGLFSARCLSLFGL